MLFEVERREQGGGIARILRESGYIPAIIYGGMAEVMIAVKAKEFLKEYYKGALRVKVLSLKVGENATFRVIVRDIQFHPVTDVPRHIDFQEVVDGVPIKVSVPVIVVNEDKCHGLKIGGVLNVVKRHIEFRCLPNNIPDSIRVDVSALEIGRGIHINDIKKQEQYAHLSPVSKDNFAILSVAGRAATEVPASTPSVQTAA